MVSCAQLQTQIEESNKQLNETLQLILREGKTERQELSEKLDTFTVRLDKVDERLDQHDEKHVELENEITTTNNKIVTLDREVTGEIRALQNRVASLEEQQQQHIADVKTLQEEGEDRTNRQLRKTIIFRNVQEIDDDESFKDTKELLARLISTHCEETSYEFSLGNIDRAHRESKRRPNRLTGEAPTREGKRLIFAVFHSWDFCQRVIESFRMKCIRETNFVISADQMYGPLTSRRRKLAFQKRRELKVGGLITSGYVDFPARLMVSMPGEVDETGKKLYKLHSNFSKHQVDT